MHISDSSFDLLVLGSGPAGRQAAVQGAALGKRVAIVERTSGPAGTVHSALLELIGEAARAYRGAFRTRHELTVDDLLWRSRQVIDHERDAVASRLRRHGIHVVHGDASFADPHTVVAATAGTTRVLRARRIVIAVGTNPWRPPSVDFDDETVLDSDGILGLRQLPRTLTVIGGGVVGSEYASVAAALGVQVTIVERGPRILDAVDAELVEALQYHLRGLGVAFRFGENAEWVRRTLDGRAVTRLASGGRIESDVVFYAAGRRGAVDGLGLACVGLDVDALGRIPVGDDLRTAQPHIYAAGDVVAFPTLAAAAEEQGRLAALCAFDHPRPEVAAPVPHGIRTIPEIAFVGPPEDELDARGVPYVVGTARYRDLPRGEIAGDRSGFLKLLVDAETRRVLGVHIFGTAATELVHLGQTIMAGNLPVDYVADAVFDGATFSDAYKLAALEATGRLCAAA